MDPDKQNRPEQPEQAGGWTKEQPGKERPFDFDAFLETDNLEDQVTDALDGKDILDKDAYGQYPPGYIPRRGGGGDRGRHEAPGPNPDEDEQLPGEPPTRRFDRDGVPTRRFSNDETASQDRQPPARQGQNQQRPPFSQQQPRPQRPANVPPPRPKVIVADPTHQVVVTPERQYSEPEPKKKGTGKAMKVLVALLISLAVVLAAAVLAARLLPRFVGNGPEQPAPSPTDYLFGGMPTRAPVTVTDPPAPTAPPVTDVPAATPPPMVYYTVTVTAGSAGSITPSGVVSVQEGDSISFTITPDWGYVLAQLIVDGNNVPVSNGYTFTDVHEDHTIYAVFQAETPVTDVPVTDVPVPDAPVVPDEPVTDVPVPDAPAAPEEPALPDAPPAVEG